MLLFVCVTQSADVVDTLFDLKGIAEIPVDDGHDRSWLQAMMQPSVPVVPISIVPEKSPSPGPALPPSPLPRPLSSLSASAQDGGQFPALGAELSKPLRHSPLVPSSNLRPPSSNGRRRERSFAHSSVGVSEHSQFMQPSRSSYNSGPPQAMGPVNAARDMSWLAAQVGPLMNGNITVPNSPGGPGWPPLGLSNFHAPIPTEETDMVGIMGEHYVRLFFFPLYSRLLNGEMTFVLVPPSRFTSYSSAPWMTLVRTTGRVNCGTWSRASRRSKVKPQLTLRTWTRMVS
jgi:hypothetical protein